MRSIAAAEDAVLGTSSRASFFRVKVKDSGGTFRDLSTYPGFNACVEASWGEDVDSPGMQADITLKREVRYGSLAPLMQASPANLAFAYPGSYAALLAVAREVQIETAVVPIGTSPSSGDWTLQFHGYIDDIDPGAGEHVRLRCSDLQAKLRDTWIERERAYAYAQGAHATAGCQYWRTSETLSTGVFSLPTEANKNGHYYKVTTAGTTGSTEPIWPTGSGATVSDGSVVWTEQGSTSETTGTAMETVMQQIITDNGLSVTLNVPSSPSFTCLPWKQERSSVWDALKKLSDLIGWDLRYKWDSGSSSFKLTLYTPNRAATTADRTFTASQRYPLTKLATQVQWIRNAVQVIYSDRSDLDALGNPKRKYVQATDSTSITAYGRRFCEISEGKVSGIKSSTEATNLANNVLSDLANPVAEQECEVPFFRFVELGDLYQFNADAVHYDSAQKLAVTGYKHSFNASKSRTQLQCRGKPSTGMRKWHEMLGTDLHSFDLDNSNSVAISTSDAVGGTKITISSDKFHTTAIPPNFEVHVSDTNNFTPDSTTLVAAGANTNIVVPNLIPGKTYYARVYPFGFNASRIVRGQASAQYSFVAGQGSAGHLKEGIALGDYPLNGGFETRVDTGSTPDHWSYGFAGGGAFGTNLIVKEDGNGISGNRYMRIDLGAAGGLEVDMYSAKIPVINEAPEANRIGGLYRVSCWVKNGSSNNAGQFNILASFSDYTDAQIGTTSVLSCSGTSNVGHWQKVEGYFTADSSTSNRTLLLNIEPSVISAGQTYVVDFDEVRVQYLGTPWYEVGTASQKTDNYQSTPGFAGTWVNFDSGTHSTAAFRRDQFGKVKLKGLIKSGVINTVAFTLPTGFRPTQNRNYAVVANNAFGRVEVDTSGGVTPAVGNNAFVSLDGIEFETY